MSKAAETIMAITPRRDVPTSMTSYATSAIRERILNGEHPLGSRLDQRKLAAHLGTSVIPVREALGALAAEGLVTLHARRGAYVTMLSDQELQEIFALRAVLDPIAASAAATQMSAEALADLDAIIAATRAATRVRDFRAVHRLNRDFHLRIYQEARMPILLQTIAGLRDRYTVYARLVMEVPHYAQRSLRDHHAILRACKAADAELVGKLMREHILYAAGELPKWLENGLREKAFGATR